ncbi:CAAX prenyl protease-related protein [Oleidesulfovibrio sp.]|uniref:CAAX prenyl protease-related protein n=1 Tax=Oleidesulfovibrio sp. TaxID=2909707 RepID=UPI003A87EAC9
MNEPETELQTAPVKERPQPAMALMLPRVLPFACYMGFIGLRELLSLIPAMQHQLAQLASYMYPLQALIVTAALCYALPRCPEFSLRDLGLRGQKGLNTFFAIATGLVVFAFWIQLDQPWARIGTPPGFSPDIAPAGWQRDSLLLIRLLGAALMVPVMEELFWRSFIYRYVTNPAFTKVAIGVFHWPAFAATAVLFGLEHHLVVAGILAGISYNIVLIRTRSIAQCTLAHVVTNGVLGVWVIATESWGFW